MSQDVAHLYLDHNVQKKVSLHKKAESLNGWSSMDMSASRREIEIQVFCRWSWGVSRFCCNEQNFLISGAWSQKKNLAVLHSLTQHMKYHATEEKKNGGAGAVVSLNTKLFPRKIFCFSSEASWAKGA